ncbi:glycosyltransferase, partial [Photobacterium damselae]|uniref:glycosyltransferase n=1 Tax=Photobacterium damselae TaxID=38293 RepID=UPI001EFEC218
MTKVLFVHDHIFLVDGNLVYTSGSLSSSVWNNYMFDDDDVLTVIGRCRILNDNEVFTHKSLASKENVNFKFIKSISNIRSMFLKTKSHKEIEENVLNSDIVFARLPSESGIYAAKIALKYNRLLICEVVACPYESLKYQGSLLAKIYAPIMKLRTREIIAKANNVIYVTNEFLQKRYPNNKNNIGISDVKINRINYCYDARRERYLNKVRDDKFITIGLIGNMSNDIKGVDVILNALSSINGNYKLQIVGSGSIDKYKKLAKELNVEVTFLGFISDRKELFSWLDSIDIYVQPSRTEGLSRSVIEAMSRGCPVLSSNSGGLRELIHDSFTHNYGDFKELQRQLILLRNINIYSELLRYSEKISKNYLFDIVS